MSRPARSVALFLAFTALLAAALWLVAREEAKRRDRILVPVPPPPETPAAPVAPSAEPAPEPAPAATPPAVPSVPPDEQALYLYRDANAALLANDPLQAEALARQALALRPDYPDALRLLGHVCIIQGRIPDAIHALDRSLRGEPLHPQALVDLSMAHYLAHNPVEALRLVETCRRVHPDYSPALIQHGLFLLSDPSRLEEAESVLAEAAARFPDQIGVRNNLAIAQIHLGKFDEAAATLDALLDRAPGDHTALFNRALLEVQRGDLPSAFPRLRAALDAAPPARRPVLLNDPDLDPIRDNPDFIALEQEFDPSRAVLALPPGPSSASPETPSTPN